jgi:hypothetical protein
MVWTGLIWLRTGASGQLFYTQYLTFDAIKRVAYFDKLRNYQLLKKRACCM